MRAVQLTGLTGPASGLRLTDVPEPPADHPLSPGRGVVIDVHAAGVSFPDLLMAQGLYQLRPELPFVLGQEVGGIVRSAPDDAAVRTGDRVAAFCVTGGYAEVAVAPPHLAFALPDALDYAQGSALVLNFHTAWYATVVRGRAVAGESLLVHGAAGGVGTAVLQVARGIGVRTIAVVSSPEKAEIARRAGADHVVDSGGPWRDEVLALGGVDLVIDPVGGDRLIDSARVLHRRGRLVILGFTGRSIPEVKTTRLLNRDIDLLGVGWRGAIETEEEAGDEHRAHGAAIAELVERGAVRPVVGARFPLERAADALTAMDERRTAGKVVLDVREPLGDAAAEVAAARTGVPA